MGEVEHQDAEQRLFHLLQREAAAEQGRVPPHPGLDGAEERREQRHDRRRKIALQQGGPAVDGAVDLAREEPDEAAALDRDGLEAGRRGERPAGDGGCVDRRSPGEADRLRPFSATRDDRGGHGQREEIAIERPLVDGLEGAPEIEVHDADAIEHRDRALGPKPLIAHRPEGNRPEHPGKLGRKPQRVVGCDLDLVGGRERIGARFARTRARRRSPRSLLSSRMRSHTSAPGAKQHRLSCQDHSRSNPQKLPARHSSRAFVIEASGEEKTPRPMDGTAILRVAGDGSAIDAVSALPLPSVPD
jgi:hypothetical protein